MIDLSLRGLERVEINHDVEAEIAIFYAKHLERSISSGIADVNKYFPCNCK